MLSMMKIFSKNLLELESKTQELETDINTSLKRNKLDKGISSLEQDKLKHEQESLSKVDECTLTSPGVIRGPALPGDITFLYTSFSKFRHPLQLSLLSEEKTEDCLNQVSKWIEKKWGYLRNYPGLEKRKETTKALAHEIYLLKYAGQLIGMFRLGQQEFLNKKTMAKELTHVYIEESFRGMGIGSRITEIAKQTAKSQGADLIILDTLNPNLNKFYERHGASVVCESQFLGAPSTLLKMKI